VCEELEAAGDLGEAAENRWHSFRQATVSCYREKKG